MRSSIPLVALALAVSGCDSGPGAEPASVLLVTIDTLRADRLSCAGYERETTPNLDRLAAEGVFFERSYAHAPFTTPSHASLFTSLVTPSHGVTTWGKELDPEIATFFDLFRRAGHRTGAFYNHPGLEPSNLTRACDLVQLRYFEPAEDTVAGFLEWAGQSSRPFAAWVHLWDVHRPYGFRSWNGELARQHVDREPRFLAFAEERFGETHDPMIGRTEEYYNLNAERAARPKPSRAGRRVLDERDYQYIADRYDGGVWYADRGIGQLIDGLRAAGRLDETLVVVTADHGEALNERESCRFTHDPFLTEETLRVPLVLRFPAGAHAGRRVPDLVRGIDVLPTMLEFANLAGPPSLQGRSLLPLVRGETLPPVVHYAQTQTRHAKETRLDADAPVLEYRVALVRGTHKLIRDISEDRWELYDLATDPGERDDLAGTPEAAELFEELKTALTRERRSHPLHEADGEVSPEMEALLEDLGYAGDD